MIAFITVVAPAMLATFNINPIWSVLIIGILGALPIFLMKPKNLDMPIINDAMDTATQLEVLENHIVSASKLLGHYAPIDIGFNNIENRTECGCDTVCSCEVDEAIPIELIHRPIFPAMDTFKDNEDEDKEIKRSDVIEFE